jgi:trypsin-like peptidase
MSPVPAGLQEDARQLARLADYLYGTPRPEIIVELADIIRAIDGLEGGRIEGLLHRLDVSGIVEFDDRRDRVRLVPDGKIIQELGCVPEVVLGFDYCDRKYAEAVVRIIVRKRDGDEGAGSGFFIADPPNHIVTNRHVALNTVIRIEDSGNRTIAEGDLPKIFGPDDLDLAAISCPTPANVAPIRIDWNHESGRPLDRVLVFGYPYVAFHEPALLHDQGSINMIARRIGPTLRNSLIISSAVARGCSGGPIIHSTGMAIGIVAREEQVEAQEVEHAQGIPNGLEPNRFISAIPSYYLREVFPA